jgi:gluconolactonase
MLLPALGLDLLEVFARGLDHPEGIAVTLDGTIYVGGEAGQIYRVERDGTVREIAATGGFNLGLAADGEGRLYVCDQVSRAVWRIDLTTGGKDVYTEGLPERPINVPNWGCFDGRGNYYVTDSGTWGAEDGVIWVVRPGGRTGLWTEESRAFPNGCAMAPDSSRLYVLESYPSAIVEFPVRDDGTAGSRRVLRELGPIVPDGVSVSSDGALIISCYRPDAIYRWSRDMGLELLAHDPRGNLLAAPTNAVFIGEDRETMIIANIGAWHLTRGRLGVSGVPLFFPTRDQLGG